MLQYKIKKSKRNGCYEKSTFIIWVVCTFKQKPILNPLFVKVVKMAYLLITSIAKHRHYFDKNLMHNLDSKK